MLEEVEKKFKEIGVKIFREKVEIELPLAYQKKYIIQKIYLEGEQYLLIKENRRGVLESFIKQAEFISNDFHGNYILVFNKILEEEKRILIKARIPFLDYKGNIFIPRLGMLLNKNLERIKNKKFTPSEQTLFIYILNNVAYYNNRFEAELIAEKTQLSIATVYRVLKKFVEYGWVQSSYGFYRVDKELNDIFHEAQKNLFNPISKILYINSYDLEKIFESNIKWGYADTFGLSRISNLTESQKTIALSAKGLEEIIKHTKIELHESKIYLENNFIELQLWKYPPQINKEKIDLVSLYLTLKDQDDPRIDMELYEIFKKKFNINIPSEETD